MCPEFKVYKPKDQICEWTETPYVPSNYDYHAQ
jgi:hypothetical protein